MKNMKFLMFLPAAAVALSPMAALAIALVPGSYSATLTRPVSSQSADQIQQNLGQIEGLQDVRVRPEDSSVHFSVAANAQVADSHIFHAVETADPGTSINAPVQEPQTNGETGEIRSSPNKDLHQGPYGK